MNDLFIDDPWGEPHVIEFFSNTRKLLENYYPSELLFINDCFQEEASYLDIGCALGGLRNVLSKGLRSFAYT